MIAVNDVFSYLFRSLFIIGTKSMMEFFPIPFIITLSNQAHEIPWILIVIKLALQSLFQPIPIRNISHSAFSAMMTYIYTNTFGSVAGPSNYTELIRGIACCMLLLIAASQAQLPLTVKHFTLHNVLQLVL